MSYIVTWPQLKVFLSSRSINCQYIEFDTEYLVMGMDGGFVLECLISKNTADASEFETNYKSAGNTSYTDSDGIALQRAKITRAGWHYQAHSIEITTSLLNGYYDKDFTQTDLGFTTIKFYNSSDTELTTQTDIDNNCVKTIIDWEPDEDIEVLGGVIFQGTVPTNDCRVWITGVPDIPANLGGSVPFCNGGINLKHMGTGQIFDIDGRTPKLMPYSDVYHTSKFRLTVVHEAGLKHSFLFTAKTFREAK